MTILGFCLKRSKNWRKENEIPTDGINDDRIVLATQLLYHKTCQKTMRGQKEITLPLSLFVEMKSSF